MTAHEATNNHPDLDVLTATGWSWGTGWSDYGGGYTGLTIKKVGSLVTINAMLKRSSGTSNFILVTGIPATFTPNGYLHALALCFVDGIEQTGTYVFLRDTGTIEFYGADISSLTTVVNWLY